MSDAVATPEKPQFSMKEAAQFGTEIKLATTTDEEYEHVKSLRAERKDGKEGKSVIEEIRARRREKQFTRHDSLSLEAKFGAGSASIEGDKTTLAASATVEEQKSFELARKEISGIDSYLRYSDIFLECSRTGENIHDVIARRVRNGDTSVANRDAYLDLRNEALNYLGSKEEFEELFPELKDMYGITKQEFIEDAFVSDPLFRAAVVEQMKRIQTRADSLQPVEKASDDHDRIIDESHEKYEDSKDKLIENLEKFGITLSGETKEEIGVAVYKANTPEDLLQVVAQSLQKSVSPEVVRLESLKQSIKEEEAKANAATKGSNTEIAAKDQLKNYKAEVEKMQAALTDEQKVEREQYQKALQNLLPDKLDALTTYLPDYAAQIIATRQELQKAEKAKVSASPEADAKRAQAIDTRLKAESGIVTELDSVAVDAMMKVLGERYDEMQTLEEARQARVEEEAAKTADEQSQADVKAVHNAINENWIDYDKDERKRVVNTERINHDVTILTYFGEDGVRLLLARDLGLQIPQKEKDGSIAKNSKGEPITAVFVPGTDDLSALSPEQRARLDKIFESQEKTAYVQKLFKDYFIAGKDTGKLLKAIKREKGSGIIKLKTHEYALLEKHFATDLREGKTGVSEDKNTIKELKKAGIIKGNLLDLVKDHPRASFLIALLALLGVGLTAGIAAGGGTIIAGAASAAIKQL